jgi:hypothetical protein
MSEKLIKRIQDKMNSKSTEELLDILEKNNKEEWSNDAFEAIQRIITKRGKNIPFQLKEISPKNEKSIQTMDEKADSTKDQSPASPRETREQSSLKPSTTNYSSPWSHVFLSGFASGIISLIVGIMFRGKSIIMVQVFCIMIFIVWLKPFYKKFISIGIMVLTANLIYAWLFLNK